jgi:hypothetical protein
MVSLAVIVNHSSLRSMKASAKNNLLTGVGAKESGMESGVSGGEKRGVGSLSLTGYLYSASWIAALSLKEKKSSSRISQSSARVGSSS